MFQRHSLSFLLLACVPFGFSETAPAAELPNIVIILVDDMGYGDLSCYNSESRIPTPAINSLAASGMRFTDAHASGPLCHMSRYGLLTGRYPFRTDVKVWRTQPLIENGQRTIASVARRAGYRTAMVGKWHLGFDEQGYDNPLPGGPVDVGFDSFFGIRASTDIPPYFYIRNRHAVQPPTSTIKANYSDGWTNIQGAFWRAGGIAPDLVLHDVLPRFTDEAIGVIDSHAAEPSKPLMLYLALPAPHTPWLPAKPYLGTSGAGMYGDFLVMVDAMVGRVLKALQRNGLADDTLVLFSSDNGPVWYAADVRRFGHDSSAGLRGMKGDAWEAGHRMPFIARWPGNVDAGSECQQTISFVDVLATVADITGQPVMKPANDGHSFLPLLRGENEPVRKSLAMRSGGGMMTIRKGPWKLIQGRGSGGFSKPRRITPKAGEPPGQLYNLDNDLKESADLYQQRPDIVKELTVELDRIRRIP